jgi:hypothetical protein
LLFQNGEQGWWWDPSDFSTLFQDAAGTTPVTAVEQPVGLMLDKRLGLTLGSELVTNGDFSSGTTGWTLTGTSASQAVSSGQLTITRGSSATYSTNTITTVVGKTYRITLDIIAFTQNPVFRVSTTLGGTENANITYTTTGAKQVVFTATATTTYVSLYAPGGAGDTTTWDNISVRELPGNHAYTPAAASTARPTVSARVNQLVATEDITNAAWTKTGTTVIANVEISPVGTLTADKIMEVALANTPRVAQDSTTIIGVSYTYKFYLKPAERNQVRLVLEGSAGRSAYFDASTGIATPGVSATASMTIDKNGFYLCQLTYTAAATNSSAYIATAENGAVVTSGDPTKGIYIWGADLRPTNDGVGIPAYQRVNTATDYDTVGFPVYLRADGSNDYMLTNSIDFSAGATNAPLGSDVKNTGVIGFAGTVTLGSYNTTNGQAVLPRVDASNINFVTFSGTANKVFFVDITNTGSSQISLRSGSTVFSTVAAGVTFRGYVATSGGQLLAIWPDVNASTATATVNSVRELLDSSLAPDKMTLCAGVRKLSDAARGIVIELSTASTSTNPGSFSLNAPTTNLPNYGYISRGTAGATVAPDPYSAPLTNVLTGVSDISGDQCTLRINGAQADTSTADQGTGNYGNYPLYLFSRAGTSNFLNGRFYGSVGRGALNNAQQNAALEGYINSKTKAY